MKAFFVKQLAAFVCSFLFLFIPFNTTEKYDVENPSACKLNFTVLSDAHIESNKFERIKLLGNTLQGVKKNKSGNDALVFLGDNTMNGNELESILFYGVTNMYRPAKNIINVIGNHDVGNGEGNYGEKLDRFKTYSNAVFGLNMDKPYYSKVIDGYYFIVVATEKQTTNDFYMSQTQFDWLKGELAAAEKTGKPIFVFSHHPIQCMRDAEVGVDEYDLLRLLVNYDDVLYFYGHTHQSLDENDFYKLWGVSFISLPNCTDLNDDGFDGQNAGIGMSVEVYDDKVIMKGRNFITGKALDEHRKVYDLNNGESGEIVPIHMDPIY